MAPTSSRSNIRAYVQWREPAVYAGEELECIITFKNIGLSPEQTREDNQRAVTSGRELRRLQKAPSVSGSRRTSIAPSKTTLSRAPSISSSRGGHVRTHRPTLSLNVVPSSTKSEANSSQPPTSARGHGRSLSIMSLGNETPSDSTKSPATTHLEKRPGRGHARSASLQYSPKPLSTPIGNGPATSRQPSPLAESTTPPVLPDELPIRPPLRRPGTAPADETPRLKCRQSSRHTSSNGLNNEFQFPAQKSNRVPSPPKPKRTPSTMHSGLHRGPSPRPSELTNVLNPVSRVISGSSAGDTPRTSGEFYSMSNHSDETLTSELPRTMQQDSRLLLSDTLAKGMSQNRKSARNPPSKPETLMMGYVQTQGYFVLDGSLVNAAPFEEVKRRGVQNGGGVVGVERSKRSSGVFGAFSWGNIGESLGGLLGNDEMSSMAQLKASTGSKSIPLLSTPQSLLFVDLTLGPGESRSYSYTFQLPRGLPPTHRGRAIKINYHVSVGVQRPEGQTVKHVQIPFRILGSYNSRGEMVGHDLMSPHIYLQDTARTNMMADHLPMFVKREPHKKQKTPQQGFEDFLRYTERLLDAQRDEDAVILSPTSPTSSLASPRSRKGSSLVEHPAMTNVQEAIELAVLRSNIVSRGDTDTHEGRQSANRFNIARSGQPVAVLTLIRPAYRLGEWVTGNIDFAAPSTASSADSARTYHMLIELESAEQIDPSLALRSTSSVHRVTRRVYASARETTIFSRQVAFNLPIPSSAAPTFETTGVSHTWKLKIGFTTQRQNRGLGITEQGADDDEPLEEINKDDRGVTTIAREYLFADTFDVAVPLKIYGAPGIDSSARPNEALEV